MNKTVITREARPIYSGAARRIGIPGTDLARYGDVSEAKMAHMMAIVRLSLPSDVPGNCTHERNSMRVAVANFFWAKAGSNPRDTESDTDGKRRFAVRTAGIFLAKRRGMFWMDHPVFIVKSLLHCSSK